MSYVQLASGVLKHPHRIVLCAAFDCVVRHARVLPAVGVAGRNAIVVVLDGLLGESGIRSLDARVRQRAVAAFVRFARSLRS